MKKIISILLTVWIVFSVSITAVFAGETHLPILRGDSDTDGTISVIDATMIQKKLAKYPVSDAFSPSAADITGDGLDVIDATRIQKYLASLTDKKKDEVGKTALVWNGETYIPIEAKFQADLDAEVEQEEYSCVVYVTRNGRVLCQTAYGKADSAQNTDIDLDTLFAVGSVSKQFCAACVMQLCEQNKLSVNDTIDKFFPEYSHGSEITVKNLLTMRSGIKDYISLVKIDISDGTEGSADDLILRKTALQEENIAVMKETLFDEALAFSPDTKYQYSNSNYFLLALIVELVSGEKYEDYLRAHIFAPLHMNSTGFYDDLFGTNRMAEHHVTKGYPAQGDYKGFAFGCGDIVTNVYDMDKWLTSLREYTVLSEKSVREMSNVYSAQPSYGYGLVIGDDGSLSHDGAIDTYFSYAYTDPAYNYNFFSVRNDAGHTPADINEYMGFCTDMIQKTLEK